MYKSVQMEKNWPTDSNVLNEAEWPPVEVRNRAGRSDVVVVCEHASQTIPKALDDLGLSQETLNSHIAWDPGALKVAERLSALLNAPLVAATISRLAYDCNRPPEAHDAMPTHSEIYEIPENLSMSDLDRAERVAEIYTPFEEALRGVIVERLKQGDDTVIVTIHTFTPTYFEDHRPVELGILHDEDSRLADAMLATIKTDLKVERNAPYGPENGVTHTLKHHALPRGLLNVMLEIRNDLVSDEAACDQMAELLAKAIKDSLTKLRSDRDKATG